MGFADDYIDVATRIADFRAKHPEGSIQPADLDQPYRVEEIAGKTFIVYAAAAYRTADDPRPGIGLAWEPFPGVSNFTRNSELMNAETSAVGRAIVNALAGDTKKSVASADEVRNRQADRDEKARKPSKPAERQSKAGPPTEDPWKASDPVAVQEWQAVVAAAADKDALASAWADLNALCSTGQINAADRPALIDEWTARKAEVVTEDAA